MTQDTTPTSGAADLPEALRLAAAISNLLCSNEAAARTLAAAADELVRIHAESEMRRAALLDEMQKAALAAGQATAAPAQPAAQQPHRSGCTAGTDEECVQRGCGINCPAVSPRQGVAYAALPESFLEIPDVQDESGINAYYSREVVLECIDAALASHGQAPAGATEPTEQQILEAAFAPAQPAAEPSRFGSPELQAMIIARCVEKDRADSVLEDAARYRCLRRWKGQEHEPPFTVQHEIDGTLWGGDLDAAIDSARQGRSPA